MPTYLLANRMPDGFRGGPEAMQAWTAWFDELADHLVERGNPSFTGTSAGNCGPGTRLGGYTLITADDLDHATRLVAECPAITSGGGVEIGELTIVNEPSRHVPAG